MQYHGFVNPGSYTWAELYLIQDLYSAWIRVLIRWLYAEGIFCVPTVTIQTESAATAQEMAKTWEKHPGIADWSIHVVERDAVAFSQEAFEAEEAQSYIAAVEHWKPAVGRPAVLCSVFSIDPNEYAETLKRKFSKLFGPPSEEEEEEGELGPRLILGLLRRWKEIPPSFPGSKLAVSGTIVPEGMSGVKCVNFDGDRELDVTVVMEKALRETQSFMKEYGIQEPTPWFSNEEIIWKAPNAGVAATLAKSISSWQGSATAEGAAVKGRPGEIWSALTWLKFARWGNVFRDYGEARNDPKIPELGVEAASSGTAFAGEVVCFTGKLDSMERDEARGLVEAQGGRTANTVTSEVTLVVATREASSKRAKAEKRGLAVIDEAEFLRRVGRS